jgi:hypothetical protein
MTEGRFFKSVLFRSSDDLKCDLRYDRSYD